MFNLPTLTRELPKKLLRWIRCAIRSYQEYWKVPEAVDADCEIPIALSSFWRERRDCCGLYGYQSDPGLLIALKQLWCIINDKHIKRTLKKQTNKQKNQTQKTKPLSLQKTFDFVLPQLNIFQHLLFLPPWKDESVSQRRGSQREFGNWLLWALRVVSQWVGRQSGGWIRTLRESEKSAPHCMSLPQLRQDYEKTQNLLIKFQRPIGLLTLDL